MTQPSQALREALRDLAPIGTALVDCASHLAYMRDELPRRGPITEEFHDLVRCLAHIEHAYQNADEALLQRYREVEHAERVPQPRPLARQLNGHA